MFDTVASKNKVYFHAYLCRQTEKSAARMCTQAEHSDREKR